MKNNTKKIVMLGVLTAIVVVLQFLGSFIRFGPFSISLVLIPIVVGAALLGVGAGAWLGADSGVVHDVRRAHGNGDGHLACRE